MTRCFASRLNFMPKDTKAVQNARQISGGHLIMNPTPAENNLPLRRGNFTNLAEALDYAARGQTGYNFYEGTGRLSAVLPYRKLRKEAHSLARRLLGLGPRRGARVALVADTHPDFMRYFFACQYAGLIPNFWLKNAWPIRSNRQKLKMYLHIKML